MTRFIALAVAFLGVVTCLGSQQQEKGAGLVLHIAAKEATLIQGQQPQITATISNRGKTPVLLVHPGDGSAWGWRTPLIGWSAAKLGAGAANHPKTPRFLHGGRCGNINRLKKEEVFVLAPGASKQLNGWIGTPQLAEPGTYRVVFYYANEPTLKWRGIPLGTHDEEAMQQVQKSQKCALISNELNLTVKPRE